MNPAASGLDRLRDGATHWTDPSALRRAMRGVTGTASPAARLAAARLARGAAQRDRRSDEEGRLYALLAAGYVLGTLRDRLRAGGRLRGRAGGRRRPPSPGARARSGSPSWSRRQARPPRRLPGSSSTPRARARPTSAAAPRGPCRSGSAWPRRTGGTMPEVVSPIEMFLDMMGFPDPYGFGFPPPPPDLDFDAARSGGRPDRGRQPIRRPTTSACSAPTEATSAPTDRYRTIRAAPPAPSGGDDVVPIAGDSSAPEPGGGDSIYQNIGDLAAPQPPPGSDSIYQAVDDVVGGIVDLDAPPSLYGPPPGVVGVWSAG